jgi:uncharacterized protein (TIGR00106 family)
VRALDQSLGLVRVDPDEETALATGAHRHVPVDQERQTTEHPLLGDASLVGHQLPDAVGQVLVERHASEGTEAIAWEDRGMIAAFSITPIGAGDSVSAAVAEAVRLVRDSGLPNETNAMFTNVEGDWDEVMGLIKACVTKVSEVAPRVSVVIKIDDRPGVTDGLTAKVEAVEDHLRGAARSSS